MVVLKYLLSPFKALLCSSLFSKADDCLMQRKNCLHLLDILEINRLKAATFPARLWTSPTVFGSSICDSVFNYSRTWFNFAPTDHMSQKVSLRYSKGTLSGIQLHLELSEYLEDFAGISQVVLGLLTLYHHVVDVSFNCQSHQSEELLINQSLICGPCIFKPKGITL